MLWFVYQAIADMVTEEHLAEGRLYPPLSTIREVSFKIAVKVSDENAACNFAWGQLNFHFAVVLFEHLELYNKLL